MKKIYVVLLCMMAGLMACEKDIDFGKTKLVVETNKVTPDYTSAIIECAIATDATVNEVYLQYTTDSMFFDYQEADMTEYIRKCYRAEIVDLQENTVYYYRYLVRNALSSAMSGGVEAFQTLGSVVYVTPTVTTSAVVLITETTAVAGGKVTADGGASVTERGVVYSTSQNPTTVNSKVTAGSGTGSFTCNLSGLQAGTKYYVRAYAVNSAGTSYGTQVSFTTQQSSSDNGTENGYEYVDLGLSVKWATCNVGASKPEEYGDYFAWGETQPKSNYDWSTYKYGSSSSSLTKYNTDSRCGTVDDKTVLEAADDAATANWGGAWRMPTDAELTELREQCTWSWITQNRVKGYKVTSNKNGKSIFLPAAGCRYDSSLSRAGSDGYYWSSSLYTDYPDYACSLGFYSGNVCWYYYNRYVGFTVRPVCQ